MPLTRRPQQLNPLLGPAPLVLHRLDPGGRLDSARPDRLGPSLPEEPRHARLVRQAEPGGVAVVGELQRHLDVSVRADAALLHEALAVVVVHVDAQIEVGDEPVDADEGRLDGIDALVLHVPVQADRRRRRHLGLAQAVALLVVSICGTCGLRN